MPAASKVIESNEKGVFRHTWRSDQVLNFPTHANTSSWNRYQRILFSCSGLCEEAGAAPATTRDIGVFLVYRIPTAMWRLRRNAWESLYWTTAIWLDSPWCMPRPRAFASPSAREPSVWNLKRP